MNYIGIDLSLTGTAIVCIGTDGDIVFQELIKTFPKDSIESRIDEITFRIMELIGLLKEKSNPFNLWIEGLSFGSRGQSMLELAGLHYSLRLLFFKECYIYRIIPPTVLKKFVTGKGNSKKELMLLNVYKRWDVEFSDNNLADAFSLAKMGQEG